MAKIIVFYANKGGVGKSITSSGTALGLAELGKKVLFIDNGNQCNGTKVFFPTYKRDVLSDPEMASVKDIYFELVKNRKVINPQKVIKETRFNNLYVIGGSPDLDDYDSMVKNTGTSDLHLQKYILKSGLDKVFDYIIIDNEPTKSVFTRNALIASDYFVNPLEFKGFSLDSVFDSIKFAKEIMLDESLNVICLFNKSNDAKTVAKEYAKDVVGGQIDYFWNDGKGNFLSIPDKSSVDNAILKGYTPFDSKFNSIATAMMRRFASDIERNEIKWKVLRPELLGDNELEVK